MHAKKSFLALSAAFAACFVGCEWTGSDESDSWSSAYDAMNFSGTYRAVTTATQLSTATTTTSDETDDTAYNTTSQSGGTFASGAKTAAGQAAFANIVPGSFQATAGGYIWNDNGSGALVFTNPNSGSQTSTETSYSVVSKTESLGTVPERSHEYPLEGSDVVPGSVVVQAGSYTFHDNGSGVLVSNGGDSAKGTVAYDSGSITLTFTGSWPSGAAVSATYKYMVSDSTQVVSSTLSGSGVIQYSSGAWSLQINPAMPSAQTITIRYSYYIKNSASSGTTTITTTTGNEVSSLTVSQNGQNLTITLNNGIVMSGKFTNVQQTGKVNQDTSSGYNTYNAQFQVSTTDNKFVGSLNYDLVTGYRMLNGTWTWGKSSYDVQAVGPAWVNSADSSTLSSGVITN